jgi:hypothetical protein
MVAKLATQKKDKNNELRSSSWSYRLSDRKENHNDKYYARRHGFKIRNIKNVATMRKT